MSKGNFKITIVGDGYVGKTCLLMSYQTKTPPAREYIPTVFENYDEDYELNGEIYGISLWDTAGQEEYNSLRVLSYPNTNCFVLCYAINIPPSFENIKIKWIPELRKYCPYTPIILVGTKSDMRRVDDPNLKLVRTETAIELAKEVKAGMYLECSAQNLENIDEVIKFAVTACLKSTVPARKKSCVLL